MKVYYNGNLNLEDLKIGDVIVSVAVCPRGSQKITEEFGSMAEARKYIKEENLFSDCECWYLAAETINEQGDLNPAYWGKNKNEAVNKLKKVLDRREKAEKLNTSLIKGTV